MAPDEAREAALRAFGNIAMTAEDTRAVWIPVWLDQLVQDAATGFACCGAIRRSASS